MRGTTRKGQKGLTVLELVLQLEGDIRRRLEPIRMTPLQAVVLLFLCRRTGARVTDTAAALGVRLSTLSGVVTTLARKRWSGGAVIQQSR
jgi:DNA-binding MarR family transcriptional regulator